MLSVWIGGSAGTECEGVKRLEADGEDEKVIVIGVEV